MKTPIALFLTDTHLSESNIEVVKSVFRQAIEKAKELGFDRIFHLGDIFHSRKGQTQEVLSAFDDILDEMEEAKLVLVVVIGNHDKSDYSSWKSFLKSYKRHPGIDLITHCAGYPLTEDIFLGLLPFFEDEEYLKRFAEMQEHGSKKKINVLGTHIGIAGSVMNSGIAVSSSITPTLFNDYDLVLVGHYHTPQELAGGKIKYIGSSLAHNFAETGVKGAVVLYEDLTIETLPFVSPQYLTFQVNVNDINLKDIADIKKEKEETGDNIRIVLTGKEADIKSFNRTELLAAGIKVEMKEDKIDKQELESRIEPFDATSLSHEFTIFCEKNGLDEDQGKKYFNKVIA